MEAIARTITENAWSIEIVSVISNKSKAQGLEIAKNLGIKTEIIPKGEDFFEDLVRAVDRHQPDLVVLAGFMKLLPESFISRFENKIINIHPSLLPDFKGLDAQKQALEAGVKEAGCTVHLVTPQMDSGRILAQAKVDVLSDDTVETLSARILEKEHELYPQVVYAISSGKISLN